MDCTEIKVEMAAELEPLVITEDGDEAEGLCETEAAGGLAVETQSSSEESAPKKEEEHTEEDKNGDNIATNMCVEEHSAEKQPSNAEDEVAVVGEDKDKENKSEEDDNRDERTRAEGESEGQTLNKKHEKSEEVAQDEPQVETQKKDSSEQQPEGTESKAEDLRKAHRLTPDFPEALYELLCTMQEGRRLNDQRCSFSLESGVRRRRCHSEPNTSRPANRVVFSSMTSLQKEEFFDLVATAQARRLDDQRAKLGGSEPSKSKGRSFRGSIRQLSLMKRPAPAPTPPPPAPAPKEDLYDMILTTQAQGRLEDQRSRAPGPMDDDDFFSLLLRVQGGRMDEQRTELPCMLQT